MDATTVGVVVNAASGLVGALIGGGAALWATRIGNRAAARLLRIEKMDEAVARCSATMYRVDSACRPGFSMPEGLLDDAFLHLRLAAFRSRENAPHLSYVLTVMAGWLKPLEEESDANLRPAMGAWALAVDRACAEWQMNAEDFEQRKPAPDSFRDDDGAV